MSGAQSGDTTAWYVLYCNPWQEARVESNLRAWGVEAFLPKYLLRRDNPFANAPTYLSKPLFPRYVFARFDPKRLLHKVRYTRGVAYVLSFGDGPTPIDEEIVGIIQSRVDPDGLIQLDEPLRPGDPVVVRVGPLRDLEGIFESEITSEARVSILLTAIRYQARIVVEKAAVTKMC